MGKKQLVTQLVEDIISGAADGSAKITAQMIVERLSDEGYLVLGYGDVDVDKVVMKFSDTFGTTRVHKTDRYAAARLVKAHGSQAVCGIIGLLGANSHEKYAPVVGSVTQLEDKFVQVLAFLRKLNTDDGVIDVG